MGTKAKHESGVMSFYDGATYERVLPVAPCVFFDDFIRADPVVLAAGSAAEGQTWVKTITAAVGTPTVAGLVDQSGGIMQCVLEATSEAQTASLHMDDNRMFDVTKGLQIEMRVRASVLPTLGGELVFGLMGDVGVPDTVAYSAFFTMDGSGEVFCEIDDATTDASETSGVTATAAQTKIYRIDFRDVTDVRFYIDGVHVATTTKAYAATGANAILQPWIGGYKVASSAGLGTIDLDYVRIWQNRV